MQQKKIFLKGIDSDTASELMQQGFCRYRLNVRVMSSNDANAGAIETVNGNVLVSFTLPIGNNTVIGSYEDQLQKKIYYFLYNDASNHSILEFDQVTNTISYVLTLAALNFDINHLITSINTIRKTDTEYLLYWTDNFNAPRKINIYRAKQYTLGDFVNGYASPFDPELLYRIKQPPLFPPSYTWTGNNVNQQIINTSLVNFDFSSIGFGPQIAVLPFLQSPVIPVFNNTTHEFTVGVAGIYDLPIFINFFVNPICKIDLYKNGVSIYTNTFVSTTFSTTISGISLNIGDVLHWEIDKFSSLADIIITSATWDAFLITGTTINKPNYLFNKLYQFQYRYFCDDYEFTSASPMSGYVFPNTTMDYITEDNVVSQDNKITLTLNTGNNSVTKIQVWAKEYSQTAFSIIDTIDKKELGLSDNNLYFYDFLGNNIQLPIVANDQIKLFDNVPLKSQAQEIINNARIVDGFITEGFDPVIINTQLVIGYRAVDSWVNNGHYPKVSYPKSGGKYTYGIVYYNHANQSGVTNISNWQFDIQKSGVFGTELTIPFINEDSYSHLGRIDGTFMQYVPIISMTINHFPPSWATHYQIVQSKELSYSKYLQFCANDINYYNGSTPGVAATATQVHVDLSNLVGTAGTAYNQMNPNSILVYDFTKGDRIRFISQRMATTNTSLAGDILDYNDTQIDSFNAGTLILTIPSNTNPSTDPLRKLNAGCFFEIYTPKLNASADEIETFEIVECFPIVNGFHFGNTQNQTVSVPAIVEISGGDSFRRQQYMPHLLGNLFTANFVESQNVNNMFLSMASNEGRPNRVDPSFREIVRPSTIYYSESFIPETLINGLSTVYDTNFENYNQNYRGIYKMFSTNDALLIFQELKIGRVPVQRVIYEQSANGENTVGASTNVLSPQAIYYIEEYGIGVYPESFAWYGAAKYGIDVRRGVVWRLSNDGLTPISEYLQQNYFTALCRQILQSPQKVNIYGIYDKRFNEYVICVSAFTYFDSLNEVMISVPAQTIAFNEKENLWSTHYSFVPENMVNNGVNIITFKNGQLWKHNDNQIQNNFYGVQYASEIWSICNENPSNVKVLEAVSEETNSAWEAYEISTPNGQLSNLITSDFQQIENMQYAAILRDQNTPNVTNPLIEGDALRDTTFLAKFRYSLTTFNRIFALNFKYIISNLHNR